MKFKKHLTKIVVIVAGMAGLSTLWSNCAPNMFESAKFLSSEASSGTYDQTDSPYTLMSANQYFQSMLNVTGQSGLVAAPVRSEYDLRSGAMAGNYSLTSVNGPLMIASTSLAGQVCGSMLSAEKAEAASARTFFGAIDFTKPISGQAPDSFLNVAAVMAQDFYGRDLSSDEASILSSFYQEFVSQLSSTDAASAAQTSNLYLSLCSGMLSSFDAMTN